MGFFDFWNSKGSKVGEMTSNWIEFFREFAFRLKQSSDSLASASTQQAAAIQETVASLTEIRRMLGQTDEHIRNSLDLTERATTLGRKGNQTIGRLQNSMNAIAEANRELEKLREAFQLIQAKTRIINDIVFKTQLLSFNASIEAARAGQSGKGFSVVAEEVGRLAQTSGKASKEIESLLIESQEKVGRIVDQVLKRAEEGARVTSEVNGNFLDISQSIQEMAQVLSQVGEASREQLAGMDQASRAMEQIDQATVANRQSAEQVAKIAGEIQSFEASIHRGENPGSLEPIGPAERLGAESRVEVGPVHQDVVSLVDRLANRPRKSFGKNVQAADFSADDPSFKKQGE
jgi:methyl-accepting chemotaxis protein